MKLSKCIVAAALLTACAFHDVHSPLLAAETGQWKPPALESLPSVDGLPDVFSIPGGKRVINADDWQKRREEIKAMMQYYQYGHLPPRPDKVTATHMKRTPHKSGKGSRELLTLLIGSKEKLRMRAALYIPSTGGPFPVVIREEGSLGRTKEVPLFLEKGYMFIEYARHDLDPDKPNVVGRAQKAYPDRDWATLAVWAWGGMRVVDYLETRDDVDTKRIAITGHSRGGKMALLAGALDERFALVVPNGSGAGGAGSYRVLGPGAESLGMNDKPHWYHPRLRWFDGKEDRLPFDQHFLKALVAPRALLCTESLDDLFANPLGTQITSMAAMEVYRLFGAETKNGLHFRRGGHASNREDWEALLAFAEWHFFGRAPKDPTRFWQTPLPLPKGFVADKSRQPVHPGASREDPVATRVGAPPDRPFMQFVSVTSPGNAPDENRFDRGAFGSVAYPFEIGKYPVTSAQYARFLNAMAASDPNGLYHPRMGRDATGRIIRVGSAGSFTYLVGKSMGNKPVRYVSWYDALRFCNWLHNGMPKGPQHAAATEDGAYTFTGATEVGARNAGARCFLPTENEWYKAAYYDPAKGPTGGYHLNRVRGHYIPRVGSGEPESESACRAAGMGGNLWEWNEASIGRLFRGIRCGWWFSGNNIQAAGRFYSNPGVELGNISFRVAKPPLPASATNSSSP